MPSQTIGTLFTIRSKRITFVAMNNKKCPVDSSVSLTVDRCLKPHVQGQHEFGSSGAVQVAVDLRRDRRSIVEEIPA